MCSPVEIREPAIVIRISRLFREGMTEHELYEATREVWRVGERRDQARFAMAVFGGVIKEVYQIDSWHPAGTTPYTTRPPTDTRRKRTLGAHRPASA